MIQGSSPPPASSGAALGDGLGSADADPLADVAGGRRRGRRRGRLGRGSRSARASLSVPAWMSELPSASGPRLGAGVGVGAGVAVGVGSGTGVTTGVGATDAGTLADGCSRWRDGRARAVDPEAIDDVLERTDRHPRPAGPGSWPRPRLAASPASMADAEVGRCRRGGVEDRLECRAHDRPDLVVGRRVEGRPGRPSPSRRASRARPGQPRSPGFRPGPRAPDRGSTACRARPGCRSCIRRARRPAPSIPPQATPSTRTVAMAAEGCAAMLSP